MLISRGARCMVAGLLWFVCGAAVASDRPNILLIYVDDLGYGDLASYGHPVIQTPNLDALAASGMRLTNYYAPSALCSPSRAGLLTGRYPYRLGIKSWIPADSEIYLRSDEITLAEMTRSVGYSTALVGKWHLNSDLGSQTEPQPTDQGFDYFYGHNAFQIPTNKDPVNLYRNGRSLGVQKGYTAALYADEAMDWLTRREVDKPFFLMLSMAEPHTTFENPPAYNQMYAEFTQGKIEPIQSGHARPQKDQLVPRGPGEYYANITYMDAQIGRVLAHLEVLMLEEKTVVVFASDNGPVTSAWLQWYEVNAHGSTGGYRGRKHFLYEGGIRVPAIVRYPGLTQPGSVSNELVSGLDLFTTLSKIAGAELPQDRPIDGIDISTILLGKALPDRTMFWALPGPSSLEYAIRREGWKLLVDKQNNPVELYNLADDPLELFNRIHSEPARVKILLALLSRTLASIDQDPMG